MPAGALSETFQSSVGKIAWETFGDGPPLVMVHGTPFSSFIWRSIARSLQSKFKIHLFDLVGYGQSEKVSEVSLGVQNTAMTELLDHCGLDRPHVLAHDFGGATALRTHLLDGRDYERLILFDAVVLRPWGTPFATHVNLHEAAFAGMPDYAHEALLKAYIQTAAHKPLSIEAMEGHMHPWLGQEGKSAFYRQIAQFNQKHTIEIEDKLSQVRCPVRVLWGEMDDWLPLEQGHQLAKTMGAPELTIVPGAGHMVQEDAPHALIDQVLRHMR